MRSISKSFSLLLILILTVSSLMIIKPAFAQPPVTYPEIAILTNGSVQSSLTPSPISNEGNIYIINENISDYGLDVQISNILLLGEGNTLHASAEYNTNSAITIEGNGVTVENVSINAFYVGIDVKGSSDKITGCNITAYDNDISVEGQSNLITDNQLSYCGASGINLSGSLNNVDSNTFNCGNGACLTIDSNSNTISRNLLISGTFDVEMLGNRNNVIYNTITGGSNGIICYYPANSNTVDRNNIIGNYEGVGLDENTNTFYLNNFINNTYDVRLEMVNAIISDPSAYNVNAFDNGSVGNYWSNYTAKYPSAKEIGKTGIYNTPYVIEGNITDNYPLTAQFNVGATGLPTPPIPELSWLVILSLLLLVFSVAVIVRHRKTANLNE